MKTKKQYFAYKAASSSATFMAMYLCLNFYYFWGMFTGNSSLPKWLQPIALILFIISFIFLLISLAHFVIPVATLNEKCFSIKKSIFRRIKCIPLEHITDIRYDNWENQLHITYTQGTQQISDKLYIYGLFYEDTRRWLLLELGEALEKYNITLQYGRLRQIDAWP